MLHDSVVSHDLGAQKLIDCKVPHDIEYSCLYHVVSYPVKGCICTRDNRLITVCKVYWHNRACKIIISIHNFIASVELKSIFLYIFIDFDKIRKNGNEKKVGSVYRV